MAVTTNERLSHLHAAVTRPGRCLAQIEVGPLTPSEARRWLGDTPAPPGGLARGATLAQLCAARDDTAVVSAVGTGPSVGQYL